MKKATFHNYKPGNILIISERPDTWSSIDFSANCGLDKHYYPLKITIQKIQLSKYGNVVILDTNGYGWVLYDYFKLYKSKSDVLKTLKIW